MAEVKISQLPQASLPLAGSEVFPLVQNGTTVQAPVGVVSARVANIAALRELSLATYSVVYVEGYYTAGDGGGGYFYSATGGAPGEYVENYGTVILPTGGNGSSAWLLTVSSAASVRQFGAKGDGTTNDTVAFNNAIAWANSKGGNDRTNIKGTTIIVPEGRFVISSALTPVSVSGVTFSGVSNTSSVLLISAPNAVFTFGDPAGVNTVVEGGVTNLKIEYPSLPTGNEVLFKIESAFQLTFNKLAIFKCACIAQLGSATNKTAGGIRFDLVNAAVANIGIPAFKVNYGAGLFMSNCSMFVSGVGVPVNPNPVSTVLGTSVFDCSKTDGFWDTVQVCDCIFERFDVGLAITANANCVFQNMFFTNVIMDYFKRWPVYLNSNGTGSAISGVKFDSNCWYVSWEESGIYVVNSGGYNDNHYFSGVAPISGKYAVYYQSTNSKNNYFDRLVVNNCNRLGVVSSAMLFSGGSTGFFVTNCSGNDDVANWTRPDYGVSVGNNCDTFAVSGCSLFGPLGGYVFGPNTAGSINRRANNNINATYATGSVASVPASNVTYTNTTPFVQEWTFSGGTITGGYSKNGVGISGALASLTLTLQPNDNYAVGYSVAPSAVMFTQP